MLIFCLIFFCQLWPSSGYQRYQSFEHASKKEFSLDLASLADRNSFFPHSKEVLSAIHSKVGLIEVVETSSDFTASEAEFRAKSSYHLKAGVRYYSLDNDAEMSLIRDISSTSVSHCDGLTNGHSDIPRVGDMFVGSSEGNWMHSVQWKPYARNHAGINFIRIVEAVIPSLVSQKCWELSTRSVHPFELFDSMQLNSSVNIPHARTYFDPRKPFDLKIPSEASISRRMQSFIGPDPPLVTCTDASFSSNGGFFYPIDVSNPNAQYTLGSSVGCAFVNYEVPGSFNFNYNVASVCSLLFLIFCS